MTMPERAGQAVQLPELPVADATAQSAQRARSLPAALPDVHHEPVSGDAPSPPPDRAERLRMAATRLVALFTVPAGTSVLHTRPPSLAQAATRHKEAAAHWEALAVRWPRRMWGWAHVALKALFHATEWVTDNPARFIVALAIAAACWLWL